METETMDKLYLELSQFTQAKTHRELRIEAENAKLRDAARAVVETMRGRGGINLDSAEALLKLAALLEGKE